MTPRRPSPLRGTVTGDIARDRRLREWLEGSKDSADSLADEVDFFNDGASFSQGYLRGQIAYHLHIRTKNRIVGLDSPEACLAFQVLRRKERDRFQKPVRG